MIKFIKVNKNRNINSISNSKDSFIYHSSLKLRKSLFNNNLNKSRTINELNKKNSTSKIVLIQNYKLYFHNYFSKSPDEMEFDDAIRLDKRKLCEYFFDNLKNNQIIINIFWSYDPFKPRSIKIIIFILNIQLYFVVNALFINDDYISEIYHLNKKDHFFSFIPRSINRFFYTTLVNIIIEFIVDFFFVEEKKLKGILLREKDNKNILKKQIIILVNIIKNRYFAFIIFLFLLYIICLYYLICFNSIYPKIQIEWIKSSITIFIIRQILSMLQSLLETILRFISFKCESEKIFKISKLIY